MSQVWQVIVFDAELVPHVAPSTSAFAAVVSTVATAGADTGTGDTEVAAARPVAKPVLMIVPEVPVVRTMIVAWKNQLRFAAPETVVTVVVAATETPPTPP